jgi:peptide-methionine (R)-S-oxide reductase
MTGRALLLTSLLAGGAALWLIAATPPEPSFPKVSAMTEAGEAAREEADSVWKARLDPQAYEVLRCSATEPPFSHPYNNEKRPGLYLCAGCGDTLFQAEDKFDSGSGWPSFDRPAAEQGLETRRDVSHGMARTEVVCPTCQGHLGHVFTDGPQETTGMRYCINGAALQFLPDSTSIRSRGH